MTQRAASCTVDVSCWVFTFINRPNTNHIDYVKFNEKDPAKDPQTGKIGTQGGVPIPVSSGPLSCTTFVKDKGTDVRLYFVSNGTIRDAKVLGLTPSTDLKSAWVLGDAKDKQSVTALDFNSRAVDQTSYMASGRTVGNKNDPAGKQPESAGKPAEPREPPAPYVVYQSAGQPDIIKYAWASGTGDKTHWDTSTLPVKLEAADSS